jgi:hypothetical protein
MLRLASRLWQLWRETPIEPGRCGRRPPVPKLASEDVVRRRRVGESSLASVRPGRAQFRSRGPRRLDQRP